MQLKKKLLLGAGASALTIGVSGVAFAYWSAGGSGTGSATAGSTTAIVAVQSTVLTPMFPGDTAQIISGKFNNGNSGPVYVTSVTASISSVVKATGAPAGTCDASDFSLENAEMAVGAEVPTGDGKGAWTGATLQFNNKVAANQDACKGATVNLSYLIS